MKKMRTTDRLLWTVPFAAAVSIVAAAMAFQYARNWQTWTYWQANEVHFSPPDYARVSWLDHGTIADVMGKRVIAITLLGEPGTFITNPPKIQRIVHALLTAEKGDFRITDMGFSLKLIFVDHTGVRVQCGVNPMEKTVHGWDWCSRELYGLIMDLGG
jgi:hypothetical protein